MAGLASLGSGEPVEIGRRDYGPAPRPGPQHLQEREMSERTFPKWDPDRGFVFNGTTDTLQFPGDFIQSAEKMPRPTNKECREAASESLHRMIKDTFGV